MNPLNIIPVFIITTLLNATSYYYGKEEYTELFIWNVFCGLVFAVLAVVKPIFL